MLIGELIVRSFPKLPALFQRDDIVHLPGGAETV